MKQILIITSCLFLFISCNKKDEYLPPIACFEYTFAEDTVNKVIDVQFINKSENATSYKWNFCDSTYSTEKEPTHRFRFANKNWAKLIAYNESSSDTAFRPVPNWIWSYKPNIYIYPQFNINLNLTISFPLGGHVTKSIPDYITGWNVNVDTNGKIDGKYNYLFYESVQPDQFQMNKGWCIAQSDLKNFFTKNMKLYNYSDIEIVDFIEYWIPVLVDSKYYKIYPQTNIDIDNLIKLDFSIIPNNINRLFYKFEGTNDLETIEKPEIIKFNRSGYYVMEWGGLMN